EPFRPRHIALAAVEDRLHERGAARHHVADHPQVGLQGYLLLAEALHQLDAERAQLLAHGWIDVRVAAGDAESGRLGDRRDAAHERAADAENMDVIRDVLRHGFPRGRARFYWTMIPAAPWHARVPAIPESGRASPPPRRASWRRMASTISRSPSARP